MEPCRMFLDVGFDGDEVLVDELRGLRIFVGLGIQPSTPASRGRGADVQQDGLTLLLRLRQSPIDVAIVPIDGHSALLDSITRMPP